MSDDQVPAHYRTTRRWLLLLLNVMTLAAVVFMIVGGVVGEVVDAELRWWRAVQSFLSILPF